MDQEREFPALVQTETFPTGITDLEVYRQESGLICVRWSDNRSTVQGHLILSPGVAEKLQGDLDATLDEVAAPDVIQPEPKRGEQ